MTASSSTGAAGNSPRAVVHVIGFGRRLAAAVVDSLIILMITFGIVIVIGILTILVTSFNTEKDPPVRDLIIVLGALTSIGYYVRFWSTSGQTVGMSVLGMRVVDNDGHNLTTGKAIARFLG
ncbi:MAG: RDD family protein, partial [Caldilineaceae bacterium]|nr:RDD family protein [Caldilineaceae bacterium]